MKLSMTEISEMTGIDKTTISRYLRGEVTPSLRVAKRIKEITGLPYEVFLSEEVQRAHLCRVYLSKRRKR